MRGDAVVTDLRTMVIIGAQLLTTVKANDCPPKSRFRSLAQEMRETKAREKSFSPDQTPFKSPSELSSRSNPGNPFQGLDYIAKLK